MKFGLRGRLHQHRLYLLLLSIVVAALSAAAAARFERSLSDFAGANYLLRQPQRGLSKFRNRPSLPASSEVKETTTVDSSFAAVRLSVRYKDTDLYPQLTLDYETYKNVRLKRDLRRTFTDEVRRSYKQAGRNRSGEGIAIDVPFKIRSRTFRRLFGGDNVGVRVSGNITINGNVRRQKFDETQAANLRNTNTSFHIDMAQQFSITGKVGQKVEVKVDQDSERILDFQNSLKLTYTGDEDEIIQKVEAGNVALNLGTRLATFSGRNTGLFGLKSEAKVGPVKLTGIASLERGQKNRRTPNQEQQIYPFSEKDFLKDVYFWITDRSDEENRYINFRNNYRLYFNRRHVIAYDTSLHKIENIELFVSTTTQSETEIFGRAAALFDVESLASDSFPSDQNHATGIWRKLIRSQDYDVEQNLGYVRLRQAVPSGQMLACAFTTSGGDTFGTINASLDTLALVLLRPRNPQPADSTWNLMFRHVYSLGASSIDPNNFKLTIERSLNQGGQPETGPPLGDGETYLTYFWLDLEGQGTSTPDGQVDNVQAVFDSPHGELHFLDLTPFAPTGFIDSPNPDPNEIPQPQWNFVETGDSANSRADYLYTVPVSQHGQQGQRWRFLAESKGVSSVYRLGALVLEGSEEVKLNGQPLTRGLDYSIDYLSGELRILNEAAKAPGANLEITYESGQFFQLDKKTLLGARAEYELWEDSYVGGMVLHLNEKTLDRRVRVGSEPIRNTLYDANTNLRFKPNFLTRVVDAIPLVKTEAPSDLQIEGEIAKVYPNPNSIENDRTGDYNGLAYLDDFEGSRRSSPIGLLRRQWSLASRPDSSEREVIPRRGKLVWYNPTENQVDVQDVFPKRETNNEVAQTLQSLVLEYTPPALSDEDSVRRSWGGIMRYLGEGYADQSRAQFLEFWIQFTDSAADDYPTLVVDLGEISEDVIPNGRMDSEDRPEPGQQATEPTREYGNGVLSPEEDVGLDGIDGNDPDDVAFWNGEAHAAIPSDDDWGYESGSGSYNEINGTEGNRNDEGGGYPDTEDLFNNDILDNNNSYFSFKIRLSQFSEYIVGGQPDGTFEDKGWRLFRIPLSTEDTSIVRAVRSPSITNIRWARMYVTGVSRRTKIQLVQNDIVSNEWLAQFLDGDSTEWISPAVINSHENPGYESPPGVEGEVDPITQLRQREQSLVLNIEALGGTTSDGRIAPDTFFVAKNLYDDISLLEYKRLKMFVHGGGEEPRDFPDNTYQLVLRLGQNYAAIENNYYDISLLVHPDWDVERNTIDVAMNDLSDLHARRTIAFADSQLQSATQRYALPFGDDPGDSLVISGSPTLSRIGFIALGVIKWSKRSGVREGDQIWVDELRVSDIYKDPGTAAELNTTLRLADFASIAAGYSQRDADFHNVNTRVGTNESSQAMRGNLTVNLHKFAIDRWGFQLPLTITHSQSRSIPRYVPGTDTRIDPGSISDVLRDSIQAKQTTTNFTIRYSKGGNSPNPLVRWSLEKISAGYDQTRDERTDFQTERSTNKQEGATLGYSFPTAKGRGIAPLFWTKRVPVLSLLGSPRIYYKPTRLGAQFRADQRDAFSKQKPLPGRARGTQVQSQSFGNSRAFTLGFDPFNTVSIEAGRTIRGQFLPDAVPIYDPANPDSIVDTTFVLRKDWSDLTKLDVGQNTDIQQQVNTTYNPQLASWLRPTLSYGSQFNWNKRSFTQESSESMGNQQNISADLQLDFRSIFGGGGGRGPRDRGRGRDGRPRDPREEEERRGAGQFEGEDKLPGMEGFEGLDKPGERPGRPPEPFDKPPQRPGRGAPPDEMAESDTTAGAVDSLGNAAPAPEKPRGPSFGQRMSTVFAPLRFALTTLDPIALSYDQTKAHSISGTNGFDADPQYQLGLSDDPGPPRRRQSTSTTYVSPETVRRDRTMTARSGLRVTSALRFTLNYSNRQSQNESQGNQTSTTGSNEETTFWLPRKIIISDSAASKTDGLAIPFADVAADLSGLEKIGFIGKAVESASLTSGFASKVRENWTGAASNVENRDYTRQWNPLMGVNLSWRAGFESQIRYNTSSTFSDGVRLQNRSRGSDQQITATVSYSVRTGFRLPILWFSAMRLQNQTTLSLNMDYRTQSQERTESASTDRFSPSSKTTSWSLQPRMTYSFSNTVQGQAYVQFQSTKDEIRDSGSRLFEFGIQVNIAIRG